MMEKVDDRALIETVAKMIFLCNVGCMRTYVRAIAENHNIEKPSMLFAQVKKELRVLKKVAKSRAYL